MSANISMEPDPWNMRTDESPRAYDAFWIYLNLWPDRSIPRAAAVLGKSVSLLWRWSARYGWVERAAAWDAEVTRRTWLRLAWDEAAAELVRESNERAAGKA